MMLIITLLFVVVASFYIFKGAHGSWILNPALLFVLSQLMFFLGIIQYLDLGIDADVIHLFIMFGGLCAFILGSLYANIIFPNSKIEAKRWFSTPYAKVESGFSFNFLIGTIIVVSIGIITIYYYVAGYNLFLDSLISLAQGKGLLKDVVALRLQTYSGERYFAPGYVNQFKNILMPLLIGYIFARYILLHRRVDLIMVFILSPLSLIFILGTGQRGPFVLVVLVLMIFFNASFPAKTAWRVNVFLLVFLITMFSFSTMIIGRGIIQVKNINDLAMFLMALPKRIFQANQESAVVGFRYVYDLQIQYGREWLEGLAVLLPGQSAYTLAHDVFDEMFGSYRGTAPVSIWVSIWYNFNVIGVVFVPFLLGLLYQGLYVRLVRGPKTLFRVFVYSAYSVLLGLWVAGGPATLVNIGLLTIVILRVLEIGWLKWNQTIFSKVA